MTVLARATVVLGADISALNRELSKAEQNVVDAGKRIGDIGAKFTTRVTLPLAAAAVVAFKEFGEQVDAMERVRGVIQATGGAANVTADHIEELGNSLEDTTTFADNVIQSASALLLVFKNVRNEVGEGNDIFDRTVKIAADMSATLGDDLTSTMQMLGRAMEDPGEGLMMLQRRTRAFTDEQEATIKRLSEAGRTMEAQKIILDVLGGRFDDMARRMAQTPIGQFKQAWNELGNAMEDIGEVIAGVFLPLIQGVKDLARWFQNLDGSTKRLIVVMGAAAAAIGPILVIVGGMIAALPILATALAGLAVPIGLAVVAIGALVAAGLAVAEHWIWLKQQAVALWTLIKDVFFTGVEFLLDKLTELNTLTEFIPDAAKKWIPGLGVITSTMDAIGDAARRMRNDVRNAHERMLADAGVTLSQLEAELIGVAQAAAGGGTGGRTSTPPPWAAALAEITAKLATDLDVARRMELALGDSFDEGAARAKAFGKAISDAIEKNVPITVERVQQWIAALHAGEVPNWLEQVGPITKELANSLEFATRMQHALGSEFDFAAAKAAALRAAIENAIKNKAPLDDPQLQAWIRQLNEVQTEIEVTQLIWNVQLKRITDAITKAKDPVKAYNAEIANLQAQLAAGEITWQKYKEGIEAADNALKGLAEKTVTFGKEVKQGLVDLAGRAVDDFVDNLFDANKSLKVVVADMIAAIAKLILKLVIMRAITSFLFPGSKTDVPGMQHGGFLPGGRVALVGEKGPELVSAGRGGVTVTPMPAMHARESGGEGGITVPVTVNVAAMDSRDVSRFFSENEAVVATAVTRSVQRSVALRRALGK